MQARKMAGMAVTAMLLAAGMAQADITIETVPVGNAGNLPDMRTQSDGTSGYGAVAYEYNIGKYEVTAGQYKDFLNAVAATDTYGLYNTTMDSSSTGCQITRKGTSGSYTYDFSGAPIGTTEADWANRPVNYVSWGDSIRFANWLTNGQGNGSTETGAYNLNGAVTHEELLAVVVPTASQRAALSNGTKSYFLLTSEDEWYKAAYHEKTARLAAAYFTYPTSSDSVPGRDMTEATNSGNNVNYYIAGSGAYPIDSGKYTTLVGEFENSDSPYGTFDQGGNVWEWNEAIPYQDENYGPYSTRGVRGGSMSNGNGFLLAPFRNYSGGSPSNEFDGVGFRVSQVPEPATLSLLALGGLAVIRRKRR